MPKLAPVVLDTKESEGLPSIGDGDAAKPLAAGRSISIRVCQRQQRPDHSHLYTNRNAKMVRAGISADDAGGGDEHAVESVPYTGHRDGAGCV